jgi:hypothetical protein
VHRQLCFRLRPLSDKYAQHPKKTHNEDLAALHSLLAQGRISPRRASVIAYIDSLLLRTALELEEQVKGSLNYYGQPIRSFDYSSLSGPKSNSTSQPVPDNVSEPTPVTA